jgi:hypothetical protein
MRERAKNMPGAGHQPSLRGLQLSTGLGSRSGVSGLRSLTDEINQRRFLDHSIRFREDCLRNR